MVLSVRPLPEPLLRRLGTCVTFVASLLLYWICVDTGASLWDCPEYITVAYALEVGHPPGNPAWMLMANVASHLAPSAGYAALAVNLTSGLATALAAALLFNIIRRMLCFFLFRKRGEEWLAIFAAFCGTMCFAWADTVIFSAVEAEVYALSIFMTALMVWLAIRWCDAWRGGDSPKAFRLFCCMAYLTGLSLGVHELNLLAITAMSLIAWFGVRRRPSAWRAWGVVLLSFAVIGFILLFWFPGVISLASLADVAWCDSLGLPVGAGAVLVTVILLLATGLTWRVSAGGRGVFLPAVAAALFFLTVGMAVYLVIPIRAAASPPMNQTDPSDANALLGYIKRDQYGSKPLFKGRTPHSVPLRVERIDSCGNPSYDELYRIPGRRLSAPWSHGCVLADRGRMLSEEDSAANRRAEKRRGGYVVYGYTYDYKYAPQLDMWLSRLTSSDPSDIASYADWAGMTPESMTAVEACNAVDPEGTPIMRLDPIDAEAPRRGRETLRPTYMQQLRYLLGYQFGYMYFRYLLWNFSGRQNNWPSTGEIEHGNFITGFPAVDSLMLGDQSMLPAELGKDNPGHNVYYMLPLLTGLLGAFGVLRFGRRGREASAVTLALFLMTGLAIVFYLNQDPREPRERDYSFMGSLLAFAIWIAFGMGILLRAGFRRRRRSIGKSACSGVCRSLRRHAAPALALAFCAGLPLLMLSQTHDDHFRRGRRVADSLAWNLLGGLERDAILFVDGDNTTFPLWYGQEVLRLRPDITIVNFAYLTTPWYAPELLQGGECSRPLPLTATAPQLRYNAFPYALYDRDGGEADAVEAFRTLYSRSPGSESPRLPYSSLRIAVPGGDSIRVSLAAAAGGGGSLMRSQLLVLDILATNAASGNPRPVYWQRNISDRAYAGLKDSTAMTAYTRRWMAGRGVNGGVHPEALREALKQVAQSRSPLEPGARYTHEPYVGNLMSWQRFGVLLAADAACREGDALTGAAMVREALERWPFSLYPSRCYSVDGEKRDEAVMAASALESTGTAADRRLADDIRRADELRKREYRRMRKALGPERSELLSPESRK